MHVLALSGSLRAASINSAFCRVAAQLARPPLRVTVHPALGALPLFNPDLEHAPPSAVRDFRSAVASADALLIASPEYAHGISGVLKNALDWLVSDEGVIGKPIAQVNTSPRAHHAYDALREVLKTMSTTRIESASIALPLLGCCITDEAMLASADVRDATTRMLGAIAAHLSGTGEDGPAFGLG